jgi:6-phosphofructokinase
VHGHGVGVGTTLNTALEAIADIKDTASSHRRAHVVEVMGRHCGYLVLTSAVAGGVEAVLLPEFEPRPEDIVEALDSSYERGKPRIGHVEHRLAGTDVVHREAVAYVRRAHRLVGAAP